MIQSQTNLSPTNTALAGPVHQGSWWFERRASWRHIVVSVKEAIPGPRKRVRPQAVGVRTARNPTTATAIR